MALGGPYLIINLNLMPLLHEIQTSAITARTGEHKTSKKPLIRGCFVALCLMPNATSQ